MTTCADHTVCPEGYLDWHEWAEKKARRHFQIRCDECGRWAIWRSRGEVVTDPLSPTPLSEIVAEGRELLAEAMEMGWPKETPTTEALHKFLRRHAVVLLDALARLSPGVAEPPAEHPTVEDLESYIDLALIQWDADTAGAKALSGYIARSIHPRLSSAPAPDATRSPVDVVAALLAQTPEGEGVYIAPDGTLMALDIGSLTFTEEDTEPLYRLVPIEEATDD